MMEALEVANQKTDKQAMGAKVGVFPCLPPGRERDTDPANRRGRSSVILRSVTSPWRWATAADRS